MNDEDAAKNPYNFQQNTGYQQFENGKGAPTNEIGYRVVGKIAFDNTGKSFNDSVSLRVCDVGCYLGSSSARWLTMGQTNYTGNVQVMGTDIHSANLLYATQKYRNIPNLQFQSMAIGGSLPLIDDKHYHLIFATFVLDTILSFADVTMLCRRMVEALETGGDIYLLRLHPNALSASVKFRDYSIVPRTNWEHGDPLYIRMSSADNQTINIYDRFWEPGQISDVFAAMNCEVELLPISWNGTETVKLVLQNLLAQEHIPTDMPEWTVPLFQIIRIKKSRDEECP
jgi:hypothetical protein